MAQFTIDEVWLLCVIHTGVTSLWLAGDTHLLSSYNRLVADGLITGRETDTPNFFVDLELTEKGEVEVVKLILKKKGSFAPGLIK